MKRLALFGLIFLVGACASTEPAQEAADLASKQLLRLETQLEAASKTVQERYRLQQEFIQQNHKVAIEADRYSERIKRVWEISGDAGAQQLYAAIVSTRPGFSSLPVMNRPPKLKLDTAPLKKAVKDISAIKETLDGRIQAEAFLRFGRAVQESHKTLTDDNKDK